ncbi:hypothetical protein G6M16_010695 [Agrobacterium tumefaciens]|nr:hypothetical protein [Agrobacterium tumefaciens]WCA58147.1 hypothetical protein G6M16_010695 [Agrobacterium tumefaciens]
MTGDSGGSEKGYDIGGLAVWYHPFRYDAWFRLGDIQRANLRKRILAEQQAAGGDTSDTVIEKLYTTAEYVDRRKRPETHPLGDIRRHHRENGGLVFDMAQIGPHLEATWADGITLKNVYPYRTSIYVHFGETLEYDRNNPASLVEGVYITHTDNPVRGWMLTFVTNYPNWDQREHHMPGNTHRNFARFFCFTIPEDADIATLNYKKLEILGDKELAKQADRWHLARLATNAMLYLSRAKPDANASMTMFRGELEGTNKSEIYECGGDEVDWNIDWTNVTLTPGRWIVDDPGGDGRFMVTRWIPPKVVWPENKDAYLRDGGKVLEFRAQKKTAKS